MSKKIVWIGLIAGLVTAIITSSRSPRPLSIGTLNQLSPVDSSIITTPLPIPGRPQVAVLTPKGQFVIEIRPDLAPKSAENFLNKWNSAFCNGRTFHRVEDWIVQGCDPNGDGTGGTTSLPTETSTQSFVRGSVGVARKTTPRDMSNDSQFFITKKDSAFLDSEYTYLGKVISGMGVVDTLTSTDKIVSTTLLTK